MKKELRFPGGELELLTAMDAAGCVLTENGTYCYNMENGKLPLRITGTYTVGDGSWTLTCRVMPTPRIAAIGAVFAALFLFGLVTFFRTGVMTSALLFGVLTAALLINYLSQKKHCLRRFENTLLRKLEF